MGTYQGMKEFEPLYCEELGMTYAYIPKGYAAMSAPAFAALKAQVLVLEGTLGFHRLYSPETGTTNSNLDMMLRIWLMTIPKPQRIIRWEDIQHTSPTDFYYRGEHSDGDLHHWRELPEDVTMFSKAEDLLDFKLTYEYLVEYIGC